MDSHPIPTNYCIDCGPTPVAHAPAWFTSLVVTLLTPMGMRYAGIKALLQRVSAWIAFDRMLASLIRLCHRVRLGTIHLTPHPDLSERAKALWQEAQSRSIPLWEFRPFGFGIELFIAEHRPHTRVFNSLPRPAGHHRKSLEWMDDKHIMQQVFARASIPVPRGGAALTTRQAIRLFRRLTPPVIVKPRMNSRGRHTFTNLRTPEHVAHAFASARKLCPWVVVQEELRGEVFRVTMVGGKMAAALMRTSPAVQGDGVHTIHQLVAHENARPERHQPPFHPLVQDERMTHYLARSGRTWHDTPAAGVQVKLFDGVGRGRGALTYDVTDSVHEENIRLFERIARVVDDSLVGIDFIAETLERPWHAQARGGVIELNSLPFIDLHLAPFHGTPRNIAGLVWDTIYPS